MFPNRFLGRCPSHGLWGLLGPLCFGEAITQLHCVSDISHMPFLFQPSRLVSIIFFKTCTLPACSKSSDWCCPWARKFVFHLKNTGSLNAHFDKPCKIKAFTITFSCLSYFLNLSTTYVSQKTSAGRGHQAPKPLACILTPAPVAAVQVSGAAARLAVLRGGAEGWVHQPWLICH